MVENAPVDTYVGIMASLQSSVPLVYTIVGGNENAVFRMQNCSGIIFVDRNALDFESKRLYNLTVTVLGDLPTNATALISVTGATRLHPCFSFLCRPHCLLRPLTPSLSMLLSR